MEAGDTGSLFPSGSLQYITKPSVKDIYYCRRIPSFYKISWEVSSDNWQKPKNNFLLMSYISIEEFETIDSASGAKKSCKMLRTQ